jgi:anthranilate/para-aminobenzoate synthase component II
MAETAGHPPASPLRLGVSMRVSVADTGEARDCLAQDWIAFLARVAPEVSWVPVPNAGKLATLRYVETWSLNAFLLTGGNDLGERPERDETERTLISHALAQDLPLLAVCRGLQLLNAHCGGGALAQCGGAHVATEHALRCLESGHGLSAGAEFQVNSYHGYGIPTDSLGSDLTPYAATVDGEWIEAARTKSGRCWGIMWHPERPSPSAELDRLLVRSVLGIAGSNT